MEVWLSFTVYHLPDALNRGDAPYPLTIKAFYGTSDNAVRTQVWIAISVYLLVAILKKRLRLPASLYTILQIFQYHLVRENAHFTGAFSNPATNDYA